MTKMRAMPSSTGLSQSVHYELRGSPEGPPLVILRGLARGLRHWPETFLAELEPHFCLVLVDNRGVGKSEVVKTPYSTKDMADDVVRVLDHAEIERAHLFGMSLGGMIAQWAAIRFPRRIDRLVLGCTTPGGRTSERARLSVFVSLARARFADEHARAEMEAKYLLSDAFRLRHGEVIARWAELAREEPVARVTAVLQLLAAARHRALDDLHRISAPTLVLSAREDAMVPPSNSRVLARRIQKAELHWLPGSAHDFATELPSKTAGLLREFCAR